MPESKFMHHAPATVIKSGELPDEVAKAAEGKSIDKWFYATVEAEDREGDVVRVKGLDTTKYAQAGGPIKVLIQHQKSPNASSHLPIVGGVSEWVATKHKANGLPAMVAGVKFVDTELGREAKVLADAGLLDVSIGFEPLEASPRSGGGKDFTKAAVSEISVCVMGMNQYAGIVRALEDEPVNEKLSRLDAGLDRLEKLNSKLDSLIDDVACAAEVRKSNAEGQTADRATAPPAQPAVDHAKALADLKALAARL